MGTKKALHVLVTHTGLALERQSAAVFYINDIMPLGSCGP